MEATTWPASRQYEDRAVTWDKKFEHRRTEAYGGEDVKLTPVPPQTKLTVFYDRQAIQLDPQEYAYSALRRYLKYADEGLLSVNTPAPEDTSLALVNDRRDPEQGVLSGRNWQRYQTHPPIGADKEIMVLDARGLNWLLSQNRNNRGAERRVIYIPNITRLSTLALVLTVSTVQATILRDFLQRYLSYRVFFGVSVPNGFVLESHIPYFALRSGPEPIADKRKLRRHGKFIWDRRLQAEQDYLYEAQISILVTGVDEWFWTAYCFTDTFFGKEDSAEYYFKQHADGPSGGEIIAEFPIWNPREYFIRVLCRRMRQATKEWGNVVSTLEERLETFEESIFNNPYGDRFGDDEKYTRTKANTRTVQLLRLLNNSLVKTIDSWERFEAGEIRCFHLGRHDSSRTQWDSYLAAIEKDVTELRFLSRSLQQRIDMFDHLRDGLVNASQLVESRAASDQNKSIGRLTWVTVVYLPLSLATGIFSMSIIPKGVPWLAYGFLTATLSLVTLSSAGFLPIIWHWVYHIPEKVSHMREIVQDEIWPWFLKAWKRQFRPLRYPLP